MNESRVECEECHYEFNYQPAHSETRGIDYPLILRCPECGIAQNFEHEVVASKGNHVFHGAHASSKTGIKIWLAMLGPIILLAAAAFLSMPLLKLSILLYLPGIAIIAVVTWAIAFLSSLLLNKYATHAKVVILDDLPEDDVEFYK